MKITIDVPGSAMCVGAFVNYRRKSDGDHNFTTTNFLLDCSLYDSVQISETGELTYHPKKGESNA